MLAEALVEENVVACGSREHHAHAHAVGTIFLNQTDGVGRVAKTLRHLAAELVAHDTCEVDVAEGHILHILLAGHNHTGHPEEDDVGTCNEVRGGIIIFYLLVAGVVDAVEQRDRPEP